MMWALVPPARLGAHRRTRPLSGWRRGPAVHPVPYDGVVLADEGGAADRTQSSHGRDGRHHRGGHISTWVQFGAPGRLRAAGGDLEAERLLHGPVREVP